MRTRQFISKVMEWAASHTDILGVALVGSCARGTDREDSDIDLVLITEDPMRWLNTDGWVDHFGRVSKVALEDYGLVQSRRVQYDNGVEVEFGITSKHWLNTTPIDEGSRRVLSDGHLVLDDKYCLFADFLAASRR